MSDLIDQLLEKDPTKRPSAREILKMPLIRQKAEEFLQQNQLSRSKTMVFKKNLPQVRQSIKLPTQAERQAQEQPQAADEFAGLTPKERMQLKKEKAQQEQMELMKAGAAQAKQNYQIANQKKLEQIYSGGNQNQQAMMATQMQTAAGMTGDFSGQRTQYGIPDQQIPAQKNIMKGNSQDNSLIMVDLTQSMGSMNLVDPSQSQVNKFQSPQLQNYQPYGNDDQPIIAKGSYQFEIVDDLSEKQVVEEEDSGLMKRVMAGFQDYFKENVLRPQKQSSQQQQEE